MNQIIENSRQNSLGQNKKCSNTPTKKQISKTVISSALAGILLIGSTVGYQTHTSAQPIYDTIDHPISEIETYERDALYDLLTQYNFNNYEENIDGSRIYHYNASQYQNISELDETYLYSFYLNTDETTFNEVLKSLDYDNLDDFLQKNNYLDENNNPSVKMWRQADKEYAISQIETKDGKIK